MFSTLSNLEKAMKSPRIFRGLTGISINDFENLIPTFSQVVREFLIERRNDKSTKERALWGGRKGLLVSCREQLFFILAYVRLYLTLEMMGFFWNGTSKWRAHDWVMKYLPLLQKTLGREIVLPKRRIGSIEEFIKTYPDLKEFFLDGSERRVQRPKKDKIQKKNYSGKKKTHTVKNGIIATKDKRILFLSKTHEGKKHDSPIVDDMEVRKLRDFFWYGDSAFVAFKNILTPKKATKLHPLTKEDKEMNREISRIRVKIEHTFSYSGWKRFWVVRNTLRNRIYGDFQTVKMDIKDMFAMISAGLHNLSLRNSA